MRRASAWARASEAARSAASAAIAATSMLRGAIVGRIVGASEEPAVGAGTGFSVGATVGAVVGAIVGATVAGAVTIGARTAMRSACAGACATIFASSGRRGRVRRVMGFGVKIGRGGVTGRSVGCGAGVACATTAASVGAMVGATRFCTARSCVKANDRVVVSFGSAAPDGKSARIIKNAKAKTCTTIDSAYASTCLRRACIPSRRRKVRMETRVRARPARHPSLTRTSCYWSGRANEPRSSQRSDPHLANLRRCARSCSRVSMWHA